MPIMVIFPRWQQEGGSGGVLGREGRGHKSAELALFFGELTHSCCGSTVSQAATCVTSFCHSLRSRGLCLEFSVQLINDLKAGELVS